MKHQIRYDSNIADKVFLSKTLKEIEEAMKTMQGLNDINTYRKKFEQNFTKYLGNKYVFSINSGTDALHLALLLLGIGRGDTVIVPDLCYVSTALVVRFVGATPIFIDAQENLSIGPHKVEKAIQKNTKAIIAAHMFGQPCDMDTLIKIAKKHNLKLIEDCCQAFGSKYKNKNVGTFGDIATFSFSYYKPISSSGGNGGIITFNNDNYAKEIPFYLNIWEGSSKLASKKFAKMSLMDMAAVNVKVKYRELIISQRTKLKETYERNLSKVKGVKIFADEKSNFSVKECYNILAEKAIELISYLKKHNVVVDLPYKPLHKMEAFSDLGYQDTEFKRANSYYENGIHLPLFSFMKKEEVEYVIKLIKDFFD